MPIVEELAIKKKVKKDYKDYRGRRSNTHPVILQESFILSIMPYFV